MSQFSTQIKSPAESVATRLREIAGVFQAAAESDFPQQVQRAADMICEAFERGCKVLVFGNGGSASDAQHLCGELVVRFQKNRRALPAISLCSDAAVLTACGNDFSYTSVFARQIEALGNPGDIAIAISTSGNSPNVVDALRVARDRDMETILFTGMKQGIACEGCDLVLAAPGPNTARVQELHLAAYHSICEVIDEHFSENRP